jgi:hypothetical protein
MAALTTVDIPQLPSAAVDSKPEVYLTPDTNHCTAGTSYDYRERTHQRSEKFVLRRGKSKVRKLRSPGDYEDELLRLCKGNRRLSEQLIAEQLAASPEMSRQGAALAVVTRMRHQRKPVRYRL